MSKAYKCDRCGSYFTDEDIGEDWSYQHPRDTEKAFDTVYLCACNGKRVAIDLCPVCAKELDDWLNVFNKPAGFYANDKLIMEEPK